MALRTRSQRDYSLGVKLVGEVATRPAPVQKIYGGLCHEFPVRVQLTGLAQSAAYHEAKASGSDGHRSEAHQLLLEHMAALLGVADLPEFARTAAAMDYMRATQRILVGAVFFKRLAVSLLGATPDSAQYP